MAFYIYEPLERRSQEIRLVTILPAADHWAPIKCILRKVSLHENPAYTALSYAWGDPNVTAPILVNGIQLQVTTNLESALRHIRDDFNRLVFWVDAICINQSDTLERNHQVQLMRHIYSNTEVLVWLGDEGDDSNQAMEYIQNWGPMLKELLSEDNTLEDLASLLDPKAWQIIRTLFGRPWWVRLWTVQEVALGGEVAIMCGRNTLSWNSFLLWLSVSFKLEDSEIWRSVGMSHFDKWVITAAGYLSGLNSRVGLKENYQETPLSKNLLDLLWRFRDFKASNPLDKVYGLLGLAADSSDFMKPDYTYSVSKVYSSVAHTLLQRDRVLDILHHSGNYSLSTTDSFDLPSWVPNWNVGRTESGISPKKYRATRQTKAMFRFSLESPRIILVHGILHGRVSSVEPGEITLPGLGQGMPSILRTWRSDNSKLYPSGIPRLQEYFRTVLLDCDIVTKERLSRDKESFYDSLAAFIYHWVSYILHDAPFSRFGEWICDIIGRSNMECLEITDFEPILGSPNLGSDIMWRGEIDVIKRGAQHIQGLVQRYSRVCKSSFILTDKEHMGLAPPTTKEGDIVCVLLGYEVPVILRQVEDHYVFIGDCFVYGQMDGEALVDFMEGKAVLEEFNIH